MQRSEEEQKFGCSGGRDVCLLWSSMPKTFEEGEACGEWGELQD